MKDILRILFLILLITSAVCAYEHTYTILIYKNKINTTIQNTIKSKGCQNIDEAGGQPFRQTKLSDSTLSKMNTWYLMLRITCTDAEQKNYIDTFNASGCGRIISESWVDNGKWHYEKKNNFPDDYFVKNSTGVIKESEK